MINSQLSDRLVEDGGDFEPEGTIQENVLSGAVGEPALTTATAQRSRQDIEATEAARQAALHDTRSSLATLQRETETDGQIAARAELPKLLDYLSNGTGTTISLETRVERLREIISFALEDLVYNDAIGTDSARAIAALIAAGMASEDRGETQARFAGGAGIVLTTHSSFEQRKDVLNGAFEHLARSPIGDKGAYDVLALLAVSAAGRNDPEVLSSFSNNIGRDLRPGNSERDLEGLASNALGEISYHLGQDSADAILAMTAATMFE